MYMSSENEEAHHTQLSRLASGAYGDAAERSASTDYIVHPNKSYSDHNMTTYHHKDDIGNIVIAHRGTAPGKKGGGRDLQNDVAFIYGAGGSQDRVNRRKAKTELIVRETNPTTLHLTGHSLGGGTVNHTIANSALVQEKLTSAHTFNAAAHPVFANSSSVSEQNKQRLEGKVTHHRIENDAASVGLKSNLPFGKVITHKKPKPDRSFGSQVLHGLAGFTLGGVAKNSFDSHSISNFHKD